MFKMAVDVRERIISTLEDLIFQLSIIDDDEFWIDARHDDPVELLRKHQQELTKSIED